MTSVNSLCSGPTSTHRFLHEMQWLHWHSRVVWSDLTQIIHTDKSNKEVQNYPFVRCLSSPHGWANSSQIILQIQLITWYQFMPIVCTDPSHWWCKFNKFKSTILSQMDVLICPMRQLMICVTTLVLYHSIPPGDICLVVALRNATRPHWAHCSKIHSQTNPDILTLFTPKPDITNLAQLSSVGNQFWALELVLWKYWYLVG